MKQLTLSMLLILCIAGITSAQMQQAVLNENGKTQIINLPYYNSGEKSITEQANGWPQSFVPNPSFKNMRGLALADINSDGKDEILAAIGDSLYAIQGNGTRLWSAYLEGTAIYPPSVADVDRDGDLEIFLNTGGVPASGRVYGFDHEGNVLSGWPLNFSNNWMICAPALANVDNNPDLEIITAERSTPGKLHVLKYDGTEMSDNWPVEMDGYPAVTPTAGNFYSSPDNAWSNRIIMCSTTGLYAFKPDGSLCDGFPLEQNGVKYSYQSPLIIQSRMGRKHLDLDQNIIIGANHGDNPGFYAIDTAGNFIEGYPVATTDNNWTYGAPAIVYNELNRGIWLNGQPGANGESLYSGIHYDNFEGQGFFERYDGLEGFISALPKNDNSNYYVFTGSNMVTQEGQGFVHAYELNNNYQEISMTELTDYPLLVQGFTFMNGINIGNIDDDPYPELVVLSYDQTMSASDSTYINVFDFDLINYNPGFTQGTYKGDNTRSGYHFWYCSGSVSNEQLSVLSLSPNPASEIIRIESHSLETYRIYSADGRLIQKNKKLSDSQIPVGHLTNGYYIIQGEDKNGKRFSGRFIKQ